MKDNFPRALAVTLKYEGGYVHHPKDPGGATNKGITLRTFQAYRPGATIKDLKNISDDDVHEIYRKGYWNKVGADRLNSGVDLAAFDYAVNSGPGAARKSLMRSIGGTDVQTVQRLCRRRLSIYKTFRHWSTFGRGWTRRINAIEAKGVRWAAGSATVADEARKIDETARKQGAGGAGGGVAGVAVSADQLSGLPLLMAFLTVGVAMAFLIWRWKQNKDRAEAYRNELAE